MESFEQMDMFNLDTIDSLIDEIVAMDPKSYDQISIQERIDSDYPHFNVKIDLETVMKFDLFWKWQESNRTRSLESYYIRIWITGAHKGDWALSGLGGSIGMMWYSNIDYGERYVVEKLKMLIGILRGSE